MSLDPLRLLVVMQPLLTVSIVSIWALLAGFVAGQAMTNRAWRGAIA